MSAKVQLKISQGKDAGKIFTFTEHDTFVFGRMEDCHACIPDDTQVSRHHFLLEVNPPQACLRDLGSLNGTYVNGKKFGAREKGETPEEGAKRRYPEAIEKFKREAAVTAKLQHPKIVRVLESGASGAVFYFIMEFCDGGSAWDLMLKNGGRLLLAQAKPIILGALEALAYAHDKGFVHRDLKPQNILLSRDEVRLSDFGLAKSFQQAGLSGMSMTGGYAGTPVFMPREQITNFKYVKPVSDVWSMAATIYNMLTGAFPYPFSKERDPIDVILQRRNRPAPSARKLTPRRARHHPRNGAPDENQGSLSKRG